MNCHLVARAETALIRAQDDCHRIVRAFVPPGDAAAVLDRMIRTPLGRSFSLHGLADDRGVSPSTIASAWHRAAVGGVRVYRRTVLRYLLRRVLDVPDISQADAALVVGASSTQALQRAIHIDVGCTLGAWATETAGTDAQLLEAWRALIVKQAPALARMRFVIDAAEVRREERVQLLERRLVRLREELQRTEAQLVQVRVPLRMAS